MAVEVLPTTSKVKIIHQKEFVIMILNVEDKTIVMYVMALTKLITMLIYLSY